jgi:pimeloyl-ACP methyl ester carboxylesterase
MTETFIAGGLKLEAARWGGGADDRLPLLLMHEGLGSIALWKDLPARLAELLGREVIAWSRQGHGQAAPLAGQRGLDYMHREADLVPEVMEALRLPRAHWLGHSDGGSIALIAASRFPHLVESLILEAPHVVVEDETVAGIQAVTDGFALSDMGKRMARYHADPVTLFHDWSAIWLNPAFRAWTITEMLPQITAPALLIQGRQDQYGTLKQLDMIEAVLADTQRLELDECGHSPHFEQSECVLSGITAYLADRR